MLVNSIILIIFYENLKYEDSHNAIYSSLILVKPPPLKNQIAPCSRTLSAYVLPFRDKCMHSDNKK
jgi:hypothetical protein